MKKYTGGKFILNNNEKNEKLIKIVKLDNKTREKEGKEPNWIIRNIRRSDYFILEEGESDRDLCDCTNENGDAFLEFKGKGDQVNTFTEDQGRRGEEQIMDLHDTGRPSGLIIYGNFEKWKAKLSRIRLSQQIKERPNLTDKEKDEIYKQIFKSLDNLLISANQKMGALSWIFKIPVLSVDNELQCIKQAETILRHANKLPYRYRPHKMSKLTSDTSLGMFVQTEGTGVEIGKKILTFMDNKKRPFSSMYDFCIFMHENGIEKTIEKLIKIKGIKEKTAMKIIKGPRIKYIEYL